MESKQLTVGDLIKFLEEEKDKYGEDTLICITEVGSVTAPYVADISDVQSVVIFGH